MITFFVASDTGWQFTDWANVWEVAEKFGDSARVYRVSPDARIYRGRLVAEVVYGPYVVKNDTLVRA